MKRTSNLLRRSGLACLTPFLLFALGAPALAKGPPGSGVSHTAKQTPPIQLGTSGGWANDLANGFCCGGTAGSLVQDSAGNQYILSNFHVFAGDVDSSDGVYSKPGESIIQPGLIDVSCNKVNAQSVATLTLWADPLAAGVNVDAAIAQVAFGQVRTDGSILEIGTLSDQTVAAFIGQGVKKSGRTTGLTSSRVEVLNATVSVAYDTECAGSPRGVKTYTGQILARNRGNKFLNAGDSGSLMVENVSSNPRAVGLLFAGSSSTAVANPINEVLQFFQSQGIVGLGMVGSAAATSGAQSVANTDQTSLNQAIGAQKRHARSLENVPNGIGHGIGADAAGRLVIKVLVEKDTPEARRAVPETLDGFPVEIEEVGRIVAY
jgi:hypothetical protein